MQKHAIFKPEGKTVFFDSTITLQNDTANLNPKARKYQHAKAPVKKPDHSPAQLHSY